MDGPTRRHAARRRRSHERPWSGKLLIRHSLPGWRGIGTLLITACLSVCAAAAPAQAPDRPRVVTLSPSATELVYAAGAGNYVVGVDRSSDYPPAARSVPRVGDALQPNDEAILALHPTQVVAWQPTGDTATLAARLAELHIALIYANPGNLDEVPAIIRSLGRQLGTQKAADATAHSLEQRIHALRAPAGPSQTVFIEVSADPLYTLGDDPIINDLLARCGGHNLFAGSRIAAPQISVESVLHLNPDVVIMSPYGSDTLAARRAWWAGHGLRAARDGHFYAINADWLHRPGPRLVDAAEAVCRDLGAAR